MTYPTVKNNFDIAIDLMNQLNWKYMSMCEGSDDFVNNRNIDDELLHMRLLRGSHDKERIGTLIDKAYIAYKKHHVAGQITIEERDEIIKELRSQI